MCGTIGGTWVLREVSRSIGAGHLLVLPKWEANGTLQGTQLGSVMRASWVVNVFSGSQYEQSWLNSKIGNYI